MFNVIFMEMQRNWGDENLKIKLYFCRERYARHGLYFNAILFTFTFNNDKQCAWRWVGRMASVQSAGQLHHKAEFAF